MEERGRRDEDEQSGVVVIDLTLRENIVAGGGRWLAGRGGAVKSRVLRAVSHVSHVASGCWQDRP